MLAPALLIALAAAAPSQPDHDVARWGRTGHRAIGLAAAERIAPATRRTVTRLLGGLTLADVSIWADSVRNEMPETSPWHYVNIPVIDSVYRPDRHCPQVCVIKAFERQEAILADRTRPDHERAVALKWVVHLIQDLHMPLHVGDRGDRGGNDVQVTFMGRATNLHALWDSGMIDALDHTPQSLASQIRSDARRHPDLATLAAGGVIEWAMDSHRVARELVYHALPADLAVDRRYLDTVRPAMQLQLLRASVRLATVLDRALAGG